MVVTIGTIITKDTAMVGMEQPLYYCPSIACSRTWCTALAGPHVAEQPRRVPSFEYLERLQLKDNRVVDRERLLEAPVGFGHRT